MKFRLQTYVLTALFLFLALLASGSFASEKKEKSPGEIPVDQSSAQQTFDKGMRVLEMESWDDAIGWFNKSIKVDPANEKAWFYRGYAYYQKIDKSEKRDIKKEISDIENALRNFNKVLELNPDNMKALEYRGLTHLLPGTTPTLALEDFDKLIEKFPERHDLYYYRGKTYNQMGYLNEALDNLHIAINIDPRYQKTYREVWYSYDTKQYYSIALDYFDSLLLAYDDIPEIYFYRGRALFEKGQYRDAVKSFRKALSIKPDYLEAKEWHDKALKM